MRSGNGTEVGIDANVLFIFIAATILQAGRDLLALRKAMHMVKNGEPDKALAFLDKESISLGPDPAAEAAEASASTGAAPPPPPPPPRTMPRR